MNSDQVGAFVVLRPPGQGADLVERTRVEDGVDAFPHGELAGGSVALDLLGPPHLPGHLLAAAQLLDLRFPVAHLRAHARGS
jgi:hypothetical protein